MTPGSSQARNPGLKGIVVAAATDLYFFASLRLGVEFQDLQNAFKKARYGRHGLHGRHGLEWTKQSGHLHEN